MSLKTQVKALLKSKFPGVQLSNERVESLVKWVDGKTTKEEEIEGLLDQYNEINPLAEIAKNDDRIRSLEALAKSKNPAEPDPKPVEPNSTPANEDPDKDKNDHLKLLLDQFKALQDDIKAIKGEKVVNSRKDAVLAKIKDSDEKYQSKILRDFGRMNFENDEAFDAYLADVESDFEDYKLIGFGKDKPNGGFGGPSGNASEAELDAVFNNVKI